MTTEQFEQMLKDQEAKYLKMAQDPRQKKSQRLIFSAIANTYQVVLSEYQQILPPPASMS